MLGEFAVELVVCGYFFPVRVPFRVLCTRVPYYIGDLKRDPDLENYPSVELGVSGFGVAA